MHNFTFLEQMEENIQNSLTFPFHIDRDKLLNNVYFNKDYPDSYHEHSFEKAVDIAYKEPFAFYLTEEDKQYYSVQEIEFLNKVISFEQQRVNEGKVLVTLSLDEECIDIINNYKVANGLTFEDAVEAILKEMIKKHYKDKKGE